MNIIDWLLIPIKSKGVEIEVHRVSKVKICGTCVHNNFNKVKILEVFLNNQVGNQLRDVILKVLALSGCFEIGIDSFFGEDFEYFIEFGFLLVFVEFK